MDGKAVFFIKKFTSLNTNCGLKYSQTISKNRGILPRPGDHQQVTLTFSTDKTDFYSTYLIIENKDNPQDLKTIRVTLEVFISFLWWLTYKVYNSFHFAGCFAPELLFQCVGGWAGNLTVPPRYT